MRFARLAVVGLLALALFACGPGAGRMGDSLPDLNLEPLAKPGTVVKSSSFKGRVVLIDCWATWCGPCLQAMPHIQAIYDKYKGRGVEVVGLSSEPRTIVDRFRMDNKYTYPFYLDRNGEAQQRLEFESIPLTIVVDKSGRVVYRQEGYGPGMKAEIEAAIDKALAAGS